MRQVFRGWGVAIETKSSSYDMKSAPIATYRWLHLDCEGIRRFIIYSRCLSHRDVFIMDSLCHFLISSRNPLHPEQRTKEAGA